MNTDTTPLPDADPAAATLDLLENLLDEIREHRPETPQWEYGEGLLTALLCTRREVPAAEWLPLMFGVPDEQVFASEGQRTRFLMAWAERRAQLQAALQAPVDSLDDPQALHPAVIDWRGLMAELDEAERAEMQAMNAQAEGHVPALGQLWALGFISTVELLEEDWQPPRDKEIAASMADALDCVAALIDDDAGTPTIALSDEPDAPPSISEARFDAFGEAIWAVYDLYAIAQSLGPRIPPVRNTRQVGRNDPCPCGSGKKYKKCCGA